MSPSDASETELPQDGDGTQLLAAPTTAGKKRRRALKKEEAEKLRQYYDTGYPLVANEGKQPAIVLEALQEKYPESDWKLGQVQRRVKQQNEGNLPKRPRNK